MATEELKEEARERIQVRLSKGNVEKLNELAKRYGMSANALVAFVVGQWLDNNYDLKEYMRDKLLTSFVENFDPKAMFGNPASMSVISEMIGQLFSEERQVSNAEKDSVSTQRSGSPVGA